MSIIIITSVLLILSILIIASMYSIYRLFNLRDIYQIIPVEKAILSKEYDNLNTGDLILLRSTLTSPIADLFMSKFVFKHIGLVININNVKYITEINNYKNIFYKTKKETVLMPAGIAIVPLLTRLKYYAGLMFISKLKHSLSTEQETALINKVYELEKICTYPSMTVLFQNFVLGFPMPNNVMHCYSYIYTLLKFVNIIDDDIYKGFDLANFIINIASHPKYNSLRNLVYDIV